MRARTDGPTASIEYDIEYSDEDDSYLKITKADIINDFSDVPDRSKDKTEIYVDKEGNITKKRKVLRDLEEEERQYNEMLRRVEEENEKVRQKSIDMLKKQLLSAEDNFKSRSKIVTAISVCSALIVLIILC
jgi:uridine kinase